MTDNCYFNALLRFEEVARLLCPAELGWHRVCLYDDKVYIVTRDLLSFAFISELTACAADFGLRNCEERFLYPEEEGYFNVLACRAYIFF